MSFPLVVSFFTANTPYEREIETLKESCKRFGIDGYFESIPSRNSWVENCAHKGPFIADCLRKFQKPILWLDADAEIMQYPSLFASLDCDFAAYKPRHLLSGTLYFAQTKAAIELADAWAMECRRASTTWDQRHLDGVLDMMLSKIKFQNLPQGFCKIFDKRWTRLSVRQEFIIHHQASRRLKATVNQLG